MNENYAKKIIEHLNQLKKDKIRLTDDEVNYILKLVCEDSDDEADLMECEKFRLITKLVRML